MKVHLRSGEHGFQNNWLQTPEWRAARRSGVAELRGWGEGGGLRRGVCVQAPGTLHREKPYH